MRLYHRSDEKHDSPEARATTVGDLVGNTGRFIFACMMIGLFLYVVGSCTGVIDTSKEGAWPDSVRKNLIGHINVISSGGSDDRILYSSFTGRDVAGMECPDSLDSNSAECAQTVECAVDEIRKRVKWAGRGSDKPSQKQYQAWVKRNWRQIHDVYVKNKEVCFNKARGFSS